MAAQGFGVSITGLGKYIPKKLVTTEALAKKLRISPDGILERTGIKTRYFVSGKETASWISTQAAKQALKRSRVPAKSINLIMGCTTSGDYAFPAMACKVQHLLGASQAGAFDLSASASGFPTAVALAADRLQNDPTVQHVLVIGTAVQSPYIDWNNPKMAGLLGDASAAAVLSRVPKGYGVLAHEILSQGENYDAARLRGGGSSFPMRRANVNKKLQYIEMDGVTMGRAFLKDQPAVMARALKKVGLDFADVHLFVFHQANLRLIQFLMDRMKLGMDKTFMTAGKLANTAEASIPITLCEAIEAGKIKRGDIIVLSGLGAGCILSVTVMKWY